MVPRYDVGKSGCSLDNDCYPVITKPADGCGSSGFSVCRNGEELARGYEKARLDSPTGSVIVEKFVKNRGVVCFYTISEGKAVFSGLSEKYPVRFEKQGSYVGGLFVYESPREKEFRALFEEKIQALVSFLGIREGPLWIEVFCDGGQYYFNEAGFRYGGSVSVYTIDYLFGINQVASDIYYALTGKSKIFGHPSMIPPTVPKKKHYAVYPIYLGAGRIQNISGLDDLIARENVVTIIEKLGVGDTIKENGSFGQVFALVHFVFDTEAELADCIGWIRETVSVTDEQDRELVLKLLNVSDLTRLN